VSDTPDDRLITRFLLDDLPAGERALVQDRVAADADYFDALCALEDDLILRHLRGELPAHDAQLFTRAYSSPARRQRVESAQALLEAARRAKREAPVRPFVWQRAREWLTMPRMVPTFAVAGIVLLLAGSVPLAVYGLLGGSFAGRTAGRTAAGTTLIVALQLSEGDDRRAGAPAGRRPVLRIPTGTTDVRIELDMDAGIETPEDVAAELSRLDGGSVAVDNRWQLVAGGRVLRLTIPPGDLPDGDYTVTVRRRAGDGPDLAAHAFRVSRE
jgi:hypothetical protein